MRDAFGVERGEISKGLNPIKAVKNARALRGLRRERDALWVKHIGQGRSLSPYSGSDEGVNALNDNARRINQIAGKKKYSHAPIIGENYKRSNYKGDDPFFHI